MPDAVIRIWQTLPPESSVDAGVVVAQEAAAAGAPTASTVTPPMPIAPTAVRPHPGDETSKYS